MTKSQELDNQTLRRIRTIQSAQQVVQMSANSVKVLTHDFEERYVRLLITKTSVPADQLQVLEAIEKDFDEVHIYGYDFNEAQYDRDIPEYFSQLRLDIELGLPITSDIEIVSLPIANDSPEAWIAAGEQVGQILKSESVQLVNALHQIQEATKQRLSQIGTIRDGVIHKLSDHLAKSRSQNRKLTTKAPPESVCPNGASLNLVFSTLFSKSGGACPEALSLC